MLNNGKPRRTDVQPSSTHVAHDNVEKCKQRWGVFHAIDDRIALNDIYWVQNSRPFGV